MMGESAWLRSQTVRETEQSIGPREICGLGRLNTQNYTNKISSVEHCSTSVVKRTYEDFHQVKSCARVDTGVDDWILEGLPSWLRFMAILRSSRIIRESELGTQSISEIPKNNEIINSIWVCFRVGK